MAYKDLREWLKQVEEIGELNRIEGADWDLEAAAICNITPHPVLFDKFSGCRPGFRMLASLVKENVNRFSITVNWKHDLPAGTALTRAWKDRLKTYQPVSPVKVATGAIMENVLEGDDVDLTRFPTPRKFEGEPRFIGTGDTVIMRDPITGRVNMGTYRLQLHDEKTTGLHMSEGKDGRIIMEKYHRMGQPCPVVGLVGIDPGIFKASIMHSSHYAGDSEFDLVGWLKGQPEEVIMGRHTGLPIPANAEIAFEGEVLPGDELLEGPFTEWTGLSQPKNFPVIRVKALYHRNDPILTTCIGKEICPPGEGELANNWQQSALAWLQMELAGIREIEGVAMYGGQRLMVVSVNNLYAGHSRQAGLIASQCHSGAYGLSYVIIVDRDIDPTNIKDVLWAVACRTEPRQAVRVLDRCWGSHLTIQDPSQVQNTDYGMNGKKATYSSVAIIDACRPVEWDKLWHADIRLNPKVHRDALAKWGPSLKAVTGKKQTTAGKQLS